ncbi:MAG: cob(I)yrinic acid a,c-diamide adenosyltransferase [Acidobacteria bacterium]|nr:MAG: cob(I)yrinic acid a,c-diamide adenosyltransferase [Acidobacteriota bacterium]REK12162.1 MAG: cob(I)yrinic acid a,c-diamide adenosyltransferase [Acidobacteriota bacterium]
MPRITKVYTRTGDDGETSLATGERVAKTSKRIEAFGSVDELNSHLGVALADPACELEVRRVLQQVQNELFHLGSDLCVPDEDKGRMPVPTIDEAHVLALERAMDSWQEELEPLQNFILPGGSRVAAQLHCARSVCRRAERDVLRLAAEVSINPQIVRYLNRLSDCLFVASRRQNRSDGGDDVLWDSHA